MNILNNVVKKNVHFINDSFADKYNENRIFKYILTFKAYIILIRNAMAYNAKNVYNYTAKMYL